MNACASLGIAKRTGVLCDPEPVVLINGVPEPRLAVSSYSAKGSLDIRSARLYVDEPDDVPGKLAHWLCAEVAIALPLRLTDDQVRWPVLLKGVLKKLESTVSSGGQGLWFELTDTWSESLELPAMSIWLRQSSGLVIKQDEGSLDIGLSANRSTDTFNINSQDIHVIQEGSGLHWTVVEALKTISVIADLGLSLNGLPRDVTNEVLVHSVNLARPVADGLKRLMDEYRLAIRRDISREAGVLIEKRSVRPTSKGRPIRVVWADDAQPVGDVLKIDSDSPTQVSRLWIARADGWLVESTLNLVGGWDPSFEGQADSTYDKQLSTDFSTYADVYRRWVLNEDGFYSQPPYSRGPAFDLNSLFGTTGIDPQPLSLKSNLTLGDDGNPLKPVIEMSTTGGSSWTVISMPSDILKERAGIYLDPKKLPGDFLTAAKAGLARVRVTAVLASPTPVEISRWQGNAFTCTLPPLIHDVSKAFRFQRVDPASIHHTDIESGTLSANKTDHTNAMLRWLVNRVTRHDAGGARHGGQMSLELVGTWPLLKPGDRLLEASGPGVAADGQPQAVTKLGGTILSIESCYEKQSTRGRRTKVKLTF